MYAKKRHCITCGKTGNISICDGCQSTYCSRHIVKHRQKLGYQLEHLIEEHSLLREDIIGSSNEYIHLRKIDQWEKESIKKIKIAADTARANLRDIVEKSKRRLRKLSHDIGYNLHASRKTDDFSEINLTQWMKQLNDLRLEIKSLNSFELIEDEESPIYLITLAKTKIINKPRNLPENLESIECFHQATHSASIENNGMIVKHLGPDLDYAHILCKQHYSQGRHTTRFKILYTTLPYILFFGCISSRINQNLINYKSPFVVGWFGYNEIYQHGTWDNNLNHHDYDSNQFEINDIIHLTLDCEQNQIELYHERINKTHKLSVNIHKAPFPWQILLVLVHQDDSVKILPKR